jgi:carbonic anhydrase/acetyltransferase-like protein (isoleucine patch superfamily)
MPNIRNYLEYSPTFDPTAYIDDSAVVIGRVTLAAGVSVWCNAVIRADVAPIIIGRNSNVQDLTMLHVTHAKPGLASGTPLIIGENVTIGHNCCIHACTLYNNILIGMGSTILDQAIIEDEVMVGAGSLVPQGKRLVSGYLYYGNPVKQIRPLTPAEIEYLSYSAQHYVKIAAGHRSSNLEKETL